MLAANLKGSHFSNCFSPSWRKRSHAFLIANNSVLWFDCSEPYSVNLRKTEVFKKLIVFKSSDLLPHQLQGKRNPGREDDGLWPMVVRRRQVLPSGLLSSIDLVFHSHIGWTLTSLPDKPFTVSWVICERHLSFNIFYVSLAVGELNTMLVLTIIFWRVVLGSYLHPSLLLLDMSDTEYQCNQLLILC